MRIHILGICGTFMGGIAILARELGYEVTGSDEHVYPPMSTQLERIGIELCSGYDSAHLNPRPDLVIIGNAMKRGNPAIETVLSQGIPYISGPQWLYEHVLKSRHVLAVSGTHGKTSTTSMLAWILDFAGLSPGFLIGGVAENFGLSARLGKAPYFVIEADEYDTAFFDKRSKFLHYRPQTLIINNLEFDHADIFADLNAILQQFHYLVRTVPANGLIISPMNDQNIHQALQKGCWTPVEYTGFESDQPKAWKATPTSLDGRQFQIFYHNKNLGEIKWPLLGNHNMLNALSAIAAAKNAGVDPQVAIEALCQFRNVKRRLEVKGEVAGITVYDDFAHHPTAISTTLAGLRAHVGQDRILAVVDFASYTMRSGTHRSAIASALKEADHVVLAKPEQVNWDVDGIANELSVPTDVCYGVEEIIDSLVKSAKSQDHILIMSNKGFGGIHDRLLTALRVSHA